MPSLDEAMDVARSIIDGHPVHMTAHLQVLVNEITSRELQREHELNELAENIARAAFVYCNEDDGDEFSFGHWASEWTRISAGDDGLSTDDLISAQWYRDFAKVIIPWILR